ncbi:hypothetical protein [Methylibium sp.]|uniref:hypothetical protein n=1 Tax=Methylibium sp. TaxID=2067992 RepID=UPI00286BA89D|nr:hypothetical protein [Methylibium sp.]
MNAPDRFPGLDAANLQRFVDAAPACALRQEADRGGGAGIAASGRASAAAPAASA